MKKIDVEDIKQRVSEVKALFVLGQKIMPVLEDIFQFIVEMHPVLDDINSSIKESSSKMPKAVDKIINISNATELATSEILDHVDEIFKTNEKIMSEYKDNIDKQTQLFKKLILDVQSLDKNEKNEKKIGEILSVSKKIYNLTLNKSTIEEKNNEFEKLNILANKILMALQFQDITSQQLQAANYLIAQVQNKLGKLLQSLGEVEVEEIITNPQEFNENAQYQHDVDKQKMADELAEKYIEGDISDISEDDLSDMEDVDDIDDVISQLENSNLDIGSKSSEADEENTPDNESENKS